MPTNGNALVCVQTLRGVRKLAPAEWAAYARVVQPDVVLALSDTPLGGAPFSQKRLTKSIERSATWLAVLLRPGPLAIPKPVSKKQRTQPKGEVEEEDKVVLPAYAAGARSSCGAYVARRAQGVRIVPPRAAVWPRYRCARAA